MSLLVGVDVGASHTEAAIATNAANPVCRVRRAGIVVRLGHVAQAVEAISDIIDAVTQEGRQHPPFDSIVVGSAGTHTESLRSEMEMALQHVFSGALVHVTTDGAIALEAAFGSRPGIVICAGSGSIAYARDPLDAIRRVGGLGPILADEGSGYAIGRAGLRAAARATDGRSPATSLTTAIPAAAGVATLDELIDWAWNADRPTVAALAPIVCEEASSGDAAARAIVDTAAGHLGQLAIAFARHFSGVSQIDVAFNGGVLSFESPVRTALRTYLDARLPQVNVVDRNVDPVLGALSMADRLLTH